MSGQVLCCLCGVPTTFTPDAMCVNCLKQHVDITADIPACSSILQCRECGRFCRPPWIVCELESAELLSLCLRKIPGLAKVKLVDSRFIWTEPHSKRLKVQVTVQKEVLRGTNFEQKKVVEFVVEWTQCEDCKKTYTPHKWVANVQVRQKVDPPRTLFAFEQTVLGHAAHAQVLKVKQKDSGLDFQFASKSNAAAFVSFAQGFLPVAVKTSKQLISQDDRNNTHNHKYTFSLEVVPICRYDLVFLQGALSHSLGSSLALCYKVTSQLHFVDPITARTADVSADKYWRTPFHAQASYSDLIEFIVLNIEEGQREGSLAASIVEEGGSEASTSATKQQKYEFRSVELEVARARDLGAVDQSYFIRSHLGLLLKVGDSVLGYDLQNMTLTCHSEELAANLSQYPDVILVRKVPATEPAARKPATQLEVSGRSFRKEALVDEVIAAETDP